MIIFLVQGITSIKLIPKIHQLLKIVNVETLDNLQIKLSKNPGIIYIWYIFDFLPFEICVSRLKSGFVG